MLTGQPVPFGRPQLAAAHPHRGRTGIHAGPGAHGKHASSPVGMALYRPRPPAELAVPWPSMAAAGPSASAVWSFRGALGRVPWQTPHLRGRSQPQLAPGFRHTPARCCPLRFPVRVLLLWAVSPPSSLARLACLSRTAFPSRSCLRVARCGSGGCRLGAFVPGLLVLCAGSRAHVGPLGFPYVYACCHM